MTKRTILVSGIYGVGKTFQCDAFTKAHPEYVTLPADQDIPKIIEEIKKHDYVIMDYYFYKDWNAERLKKSLDCPVEIWVLFDNPEVVCARQISKKGSPMQVDCINIRNVYLKDMRFLVDVATCKFVDSKDLSGYSYPDFCCKIWSYFKNPTKDEVEEFVAKIHKISGYDVDYHKFILPYDCKLGKENYSNNEDTWNIIKDWYDWKEKRVLDAACFHAYFSQQIWLKGGFPTACDIHPDATHTACVLAKWANMDFPIFLCNIDKDFPTPAWDGKMYDLILLMSVFHHLKNQEEVLKRISRMGRAALFVINKDDLPKIIEHFDIRRIELSAKMNRWVILAKPREQT